MSSVFLRGMTSLLPILLILLQTSWSFNVYEPVRYPAAWHYFGFSRPQTVRPSVTFRKPMAAMVDLTNDLGVAILQDYSYSRSNFAFSPYGVASVLVVLYEGARGESAVQIHRAVKFPWDRDITRIGFRDIHRHLRTYFSHEGYLSGITLSKEGSSLKREYKRILRFYGYDVEMDAAEKENSTSVVLAEESSPSAAPLPPTSTVGSSADVSTAGGDERETTTGSTDTYVTSTDSSSTEMNTESTTTGPEETSSVITTAEDTESPATGTPATVASTTDMYTTTTTDASTAPIPDSTTPSLEETSTIVSTREDVESPATDIPDIISSTSTESSGTDMYTTTTTTTTDASTAPIPDSTTPSLEETSTVVSTTEDVESPATDIPDIISSTSTDMYTTTTTDASTVPIRDSTTPCQEETSTVMSTMEDIESTATDIPDIISSTSTESSDTDMYTTTTTTTDASTVPIRESTTPSLEETSTVVSTAEDVESPATDATGIVGSTTTENTFTTGSDATDWEHFDASTAPTTFSIDEDATEGVAEEDGTSAAPTPGDVEAETAQTTVTDADRSTSAAEVEEKLRLELDNGMLIPQDFEKEWRMRVERGSFAEEEEEAESRNGSGDAGISAVSIADRISYSRSDASAEGIADEGEPENALVNNRERRSEGKRTIPDYVKIPPVPDLSLQLQNGMFDSHVSKDSDLYRRLPKFLFLVDGAIDTPVPMMTYVNVFSFAYVPRLHSKALEFPLDDERYKLLIVLPVERRGLRQLIYDLGSYPLREVTELLRPARVKAVVPTFMVEGFVILTPALQKLGILDVFDPRRADLSGMTSDPDLYVRNIEQSVTVVIRNYVEILDIQTRTMAARNIVEEDFIASHPFVYFVMDTTTNVALMAGQMLDPLNSRIY